MGQFSNSYKNHLGNKAEYTATQVAYGDNGAKKAEVLKTEGRIDGLTGGQTNCPTANRNAYT